MEPDEASETETSADDVGDLVIPNGSKVPRWVIKAIALFWVGWAVTYIGTGMVRA